MNNEDLKNIESLSGGQGEGGIGQRIDNLISIQEMIEQSESDPNLNPDNP